MCPFESRRQKGSNTYFGVLRAVNICTVIRASRGMNGRTLHQADDLLDYRPENSSVFGLSRVAPPRARSIPAV